MQESWFVDEFQGFLTLTDDEYEAAKASCPGIKKYACEFLEYGETREGYWTQDKFIGNSCKNCRNIIFRLATCVGGCLTIAAAMRLWQMIPWMSTT